ncbi:hypothetical protein M758_8G039600 [Ceratodon purpureus]|nr:hypothetical protein M758_8G039600 [Ceratodon purpureus]
MGLGIRDDRSAGLRSRSLLNHQPASGWLISKFGTSPLCPTSAQYHQRLIKMQTLIPRQAWSCHPRALPSSLHHNAKRLYSAFAFLHFAIASESECTD